MSDDQVRIVHLEPMRVACAHGFGASPEPEAIEKMLAFANAKGIDIDSARWFGFNNPGPSPGSPNYGYDQWLTVGPDVQGDGDVTIKDVEGGLYAVLRCESLGTIGEDWRRLAVWREDSPYGCGHHQWLEELLVLPTLPHTEYRFDLYLGIVE
jgi:DNA gyrase inhibitor GyrI